jgi:hypothetical protein
MTIILLATHIFCLSSLHLFPWKNFISLFLLIININSFSTIYSSKLYLPKSRIWKLLSILITTYLTITCPLSTWFKQIWKKSIKKWCYHVYHLTFSSHICYKGHLTKWSLVFHPWNCSLFTLFPSNNPQKLLQMKFKPIYCNLMIIPNIFSWFNLIVVSWVW